MSQSIWEQAPLSLSPWAVPGAMQATRRVPLQSWHTSGNAGVRHLMRMSLHRSRLTRSFFAHDLHWGFFCPVLIHILFIPMALHLLPPLLPAALVSSLGALLFLVALETLLAISQVLGKEIGLPAGSASSCRGKPEQMALLEELQGITWPILQVRTRRPREAVWCASGDRVEGGQSQEQSPGFCLLVQATVDYRWCWQNWKK